MDPLPIDEHLPAIVAALRQTGSVVVVAPPGAGKTTRVPPAILAAGLLESEHPNLVMLQPRRVAARAAAQRIADEQAWELGGRVGYQVRLEKRIGPDTRLRILTEGILTRQLLDDPSLPGIGAVILDEFHERSLHTDMAIALLRDVRQSLRPDLKLIVMSATLEAEPVSAFLDGCPIVRTAGRLYPVAIHHAGPAAGAARLPLPRRVADEVRSMLENPQEQTGDVLVFLPGAGEIKQCLRLLESESRETVMLPLHGSLPFAQQNAALRPARQRKVILSTNIAETSLTIEGVRAVIDSGLARQAGYDPQRGLDRLELTRISKASATQRAGRAGRTAPGQCIRLWTAAEERDFLEFDPPEILRVDLCGTVLSLHAWGERDVQKFGWFQPPPPHMVAAAERLLHMLGALSAEENGQITDMGRLMLQTPVHPRLARLLIAARERHISQGPAVAALLSEKDFVLRTAGERGPRLTGSSDLLQRLQMLDEVERSGLAHRPGIDTNAVRQVAKVRDDLASRHRYAGAAAKEDDLLKLALWAYPDRVCRRRGDGDTATMVGGGGVRLAAESVVTRAPFFVGLDARSDERNPRREAMVTIASAIEPEWLAEMFPQEIREVREAVFDESRQRVVGRMATYYRDLLLAEESHAAVDAEQAGQVLADALHPRAAEMFAKDEKAHEVLARVALLRQAMPEQDWPVFDAEQLVEIISDAARGKKSVEEMGSPADLLLARFAYPLDRLLEEHAPPTIPVPTGNRIRVQYAIGQKPVLAVRLQELFGLTHTPRIAAGRVPVTLHLLAPNFRPVQITDDLASFWRTAYFEV